MVGARIRGALASALTAARGFTGLRQYTSAGSWTEL